MKLLSPPRITEIREKTAADTELQEVIKILSSEDGWPEHKSQVDPIVRPYFDFQEDLNVIDGILFKGQRVIIPALMRAEALKILHAAHPGIVNSKKLARDLMYWPGINRQIEDVISRCSTCQEFRSMQAKEP